MFNGIRNWYASKQLKIILKTFTYTEHMQKWILTQKYIIYLLYLFIYVFVCLFYLKFISVSQCPEDSSAKILSYILLC